MALETSRQWSFSDKVAEAATGGIEHPGRSTLGKLATMRENFRLVTALPAALLVVLALAGCTNGEDQKRATLRMCGQLQYGLAYANWFEDMKEEIFTSIEKESKTNKWTADKVIAEKNGWIKSHTELVTMVGIGNEGLNPGTTKFHDAIFEYKANVFDDVSIFNSKLPRVIAACSDVGYEIDEATSDHDKFRFQ